MDDNAPSIEDVVASYQKRLDEMTAERDAYKAQVDHHNDIIHRILNGEREHAANTDKADAFIASCKL